MKFKKKNPKQQQQKNVQKKQLFKPVAFLNQQNLAIALACLGLLLSSSALLIGMPRVLGNLDKNVVKTADESSPKLPIVLSQEVKVASSSPTFKIVDSKLQIPQFESAAVLAEDVDSGQVLYDKNVHTRLFPASTTKVMTALVALDYYKDADVLTVPKQAMVGGSSMNLIPGEKLTFRSLLYGMLLNSGNDAAYTFALNYPGGLNAFVAKMNEKVTNLGLSDTHFVNPAGFDDANQYASAFDLAQIGKEAMRNEEFARVVGTKETKVASLNQLIATPSAEVSTAEAQLTHVHDLKNLNQLLGEPGVLGIKTGTTDKAGENLIAMVEKNNHKVITVVLGSSNRFDESRTLIDWVYKDYSWQQQ